MSTLFCFRATNRWLFCSNLTMSCQIHLFRGENTSLAMPPPVGLSLPSPKELGLDEECLKVPAPFDMPCRLILFLGSVEARRIQKNKASFGVWPYGDVFLCKCHVNNGLEGFLGMWAASVVSWFMLGRQRKSLPRAFWEKKAIWCFNSRFVKSMTLGVCS